MSDLNRQLYREARKLVEGYMDDDYVVENYNASGVMRRFDEDGQYAPAMFWAEA